MKLASVSVRLCYSSLKVWLPQAAVLLRVNSCIMPSVSWMSWLILTQSRIWGSSMRTTTQCNNCSVLVFCISCVCELCPDYSAVENIITTLGLDCIWRYAKARVCSCLRQKPADCSFPRFGCFAVCTVLFLSDLFGLWLWFLPLLCVSVVCFCYPGTSCDLVIDSVTSTLNRL